MVNGGIYDDGNIADVPWAAVFDPDNNARAIGEIQARGFRAATEVVDRLIRSANKSAAAGSAPDSEGGPDGASAVAPDVDRILELGQKMFGQLVQSLRGAVPVPDTAAGFDLVAAESTGRILLESPTAVATATAEVWLHNTGPTDLGKVRLRCSDLLAHDGSVIEAAAARFEPDTVPMPGRCSRGVTMEIDLSDSAAPGRYHGTLLADGHADVWLPVELVVGPGFHDQHGVTTSTVS